MYSLLVQADFSRQLPGRKNQSSADSSHFVWQEMHDGNKQQLINYIIEEHVAINVCVHPLKWRLEHSELIDPTFGLGGSDQIIQYKTIAWMTIKDIASF